jgi:hypothetical protein
MTALAARRKHVEMNSSVCAWCAGPRARARRGVSHGICASCLDARLRRAHTWSERRFGDRMPSDSRPAEAAPIQRELSHARAQRVRIDTE